MTKTLQKHGILIMAHNQFEILELLMKQLDHERNDLYIHIDKKAKEFDKNYFESVCKKSKVQFIPRMNVYWGDSSMVECELRLIEAALQSSEPYLYLHLLSGVDLQIKNTETIHEYFDGHPQNQFIAFRNLQSGIKGVQRYYYFMRLRKYNKYLAKGLDYISGNIQSAFGINILKSIDFKLYKTQQWFSITRDCAEYVLTQKDFIRKFTLFTNCSDEMFLGTVIMNSPFAKQVFRTKGVEGHMRMIDRNRPEKASPHTMTMDDWDMIYNCPYFWARKFDLNRDRDIIQKVYETWN